LSTLSRVKKEVIQMKPVKDMNNVEAIKTFFEGDAANIPGRKVTMTEFKDLSSEERAELADLAKTAMS